MAGEVTRNVVFHSIEDKWRGALPCSPSELAVGGAVGLSVTGLCHGVLGVLAGLLVIGVLVALRKRDHDRSDYLRVLWRGVFGARIYSPSEPDDRFVPFAPRWECSPEND